MRLYLIIALTLLLVWILYQLLYEYVFLRDDGEQALATRVMRACHELNAPVTAALVRQHIVMETGEPVALSDVRILLNCMEAEGTLTSEAAPRLRLDQEPPPRFYTLTPRYAVKTS